MSVRDSSSGRLAITALVAVVLGACSGAKQSPNGGGGSASLGGTPGTSGGGGTGASAGNGGNGGQKGNAGGAGGAPATPVVLVAKHLAVGGNHACAVLLDGTVSCWGSDLDGELGDGNYYHGTTDLKIAVKLPLIVKGVSNAVAVSVSPNHSCALLTGGTVKCWGEGGGGQIGNGMNLPQPLAVDVLNITGATQIASGGLYDHGHTCVLGPGGAMSCWGYHVYGNRAHGEQYVYMSTAPIPAPGAIVAKQMAVGNTFFSALLEDGTVTWWDEYWKPSVVAGVSNVVKLVGTGGRAYALLEDSTVMTWAGPTGAAPVANLVDIVDLVGGAGGLCAITRTGGVKCTGTDGIFPKGYTYQQVSGAPIDIPEFVGYTGLALGVTSSCALRPDQHVHCWGLDTNVALPGL